MTKKLIILLLMLASFSCRETEENSSIPYCDVYIKTDYAEYTKLRTINSYVLFERSATASIPSNFKLGYGGIFIYRTLDEKAVAFDLACPVEASRDALVHIDGIYAFCPICGSKFDLSYGLAAPSGGPARETLRKYNCLNNGSQIIVSN